MGYRQLDSQQIIDTLRLLCERIAERFPEKSLRNVAAELLAIAEETCDRLLIPVRRFSPIRIGVLLVTAVVAVGVVFLGTHLSNRAVWVSRSR